MNNIKNLLAAGGLVLGLLAQTQAGAIVVTVEESNGQDAGNYSGGNTILLRAKFTSDKPINFDVLVEESDGSSLTLEGSYGNVSGSSWSGFDVALSGGATWQEISSIFPEEEIASIRVSDDSSTVETLFDLQLDSPGIIQLGSAQAVEEQWVISIKDVAPGNQFQIVLQPVKVNVPEPGIIALMSLGVVGMGFARRK